MNWRLVYHITILIETNSIIDTFISLVSAHVTFYQENLPGVNIYVIYLYALINVPLSKV